MAEAPIVHGTINVLSQLSTKKIVFSDSSELSAIDTSLNSSSTNPLTNAATSAAISSINAPSVSSFHVHLVMNPSASHNAASPIAFASQETFINTFGSGGVTEMTTITVPISGTYFISSVTTALAQGSELEIAILKNSSPLKSQSGNSVITSSGTFFLAQNDTIQMQAVSNTTARSELTATLLKSDQTI